MMYFGDRHGLVPNSHTGKLSQIYVSGLPVSVPELSARGLVKGLGWLLWCLWLILAFQLLKAQIPVVGPGSIVTGVFANQTGFHQGIFHLRFNAQSVDATLTSTRSPVQYFARQQRAILFTVPEGYRPARTTTVEVEGLPVTEYGVPHPTNSTPRRFRLRIAPDSTARYVNDAGVDGVEYLSYTVKLTWSTDYAAADRAALNALYRSTQGENWAANFNWGHEEVPLGDWYGVSTDRSGRVTHLDLSQNGLRGTLPIEMGDLSELQKLNLISNHLNGSILPTLGQPSKLKILYLADNSFSGPIPSELGRLHNLEVIHLQKTQLSGAIPPELSQLQNLKDLYLAKGQLSGPFPAELGQLRKLERLSLKQNQLTGEIPREISHLRNLQSIWINNNHLSGSVPSELSLLQNLGIIYIGGNNWAGCLPPIWFNTEPRYIGGDFRDLGLPLC